MLAELKADIMSGALGPGDLLPPELELTKRFRLSRNSIRHALEVLRQDGYIEKVPNVGSRVLEMEKPVLVNVKFGVYRSVLRDMALETLIEAYNKTNPHVHIQLVLLPSEDYCDTVQSYMDHDMLDLLTVNNKHFLLFQERGMLGDLFQPHEPNPDAYPFLTQMFMEEERLFVQPLTFSPVVLCYNKKHFAEAGLAEPDSSWKWDQLVRAAKRLSQDKARFGFYYFVLSENRWSVFLLQNGVRMERNEDGALKLDQPDLIRGLEFARELLYSQTDAPVFLLDSENDAELLFKEEKASMIMTTYYNLNLLHDCDFPFDIAPLPYSDQFKTLLLNIGAAVNKRSKVKDEALAFLQYLSGETGQRLLGRHAYSLPSSKTAAEAESDRHTQQVSRFKLFREIIPSFETYEALNMRPSEFDLFRRELKLYWAKLESLEQFRQRIQPLL